MKIRSVRVGLGLLWIELISFGSDLHNIKVLLHRGNMHAAVNHTSRQHVACSKTIWYMNQIQNLWMQQQQHTAHVDNWVASSPRVDRNGFEAWSLRQYSMLHVFSDWRLLRPAERLTGGPVQAYLSDLPDREWPASVRSHLNFVPRRGSIYLLRSLELTVNA